MFIRFNVAWKDLTHFFANIFKNEEGKHSLGFHLGTTYCDVYGVELFIAPQYVYFFKGINNSGLNIGVSASYGKQEGNLK